MTTGDLFGGLFVPEGLRVAVSGRAWVQGMLEFEAALARAEASVGLVPADAAAAIATAAAQTDRYDPAELGLEGRGAGNPAVPLVRALTAAVEGDAAGHVHRGATSQDVMDTAAALVGRRAVGLIDEELAAVAARLASLADEHRGSVMPGRTLLQQALPTTFGLKAAGWLVAVVDARARLAAVPFAVQLGGADGTLASLGGAGTDVLAALAAELDLDEPTVPWHTDRGRVGQLAAALALTAGTVEKVARDIVLLAQTEVGEVAEASGGGRGGSSTLPHKRNPVGSTLAIACARRVRGEASILMGAMAQEHERAAGAWQAEWEAMSGALAHTGGAAASLREALEGLEVHPERMRENLDATGGLIMAEAVATSLTEGGMGRSEAHDLVQAVSVRATEGGRALGDELREDTQVSSLLSSEQIDRALDPAAYLGATDAFVDRALARFEAPA